MSYDENSVFDTFFRNLFNAKIAYAIKRTHGFAQYVIICDYRNSVTYCIQYFRHL